MRKISIALAVFGAGLGAFGFSGFDGGIRTIMGSVDGAVSWDMYSRIEMTAGGALFVLGMLLFKESRGRS